MMLSLHQLRARIVRSMKIKKQPSHLLMSQALKRTMVIVLVRKLTTKMEAITAFFMVSIHQAGASNRHQREMQALLIVHRIGKIVCEATIAIRLFSRHTFNQSSQRTSA